METTSTSTLLAPVEVLPTAVVDGIGGGNYSFNIGSGLTEIAALTALLGSSTAEALILGNNGAAGLPWAFVSNFGAFSILKSCLAAATPDWLRDTVGVRTLAVDSSLGLGIDLDKENVARRLRMGRVVGLSSERTSDAASTGMRKSMHKFDTITSHIITTTATDTKDLSALQTHSFKTDPLFDTATASLTRKDTVLLACSMMKLIEASVLAYYGAGWFSLVSCAGWATAVVCALVIGLVGLSRTSDSQVDIISGILPTPLQSGSECSIVLGVPKIVRLHRVWQIVWTILGLVCLVNVIASYIMLSKLPSRIGFIWTGFQLFWLVARSLAYHVGHGTETLFQHPPIQRLSWENTPPSARDRVRELTFALSTYQVQTHPRGVHSYVGDLNSLAGFRALQKKHLAQNSNASAMIIMPAYPGPLSEGSVTLNIIAVIGDAVLSSTSYISGSGLSDLELYDSCLLVLELQNGSIIFVPSTRVLSERPVPADAEKDMVDNKFFPRGGSSTAERARWWYWVPTIDGSWLQVVGPTAGVCGTQQARVLADAQLQAQLLSGELYIGLQSVSEVKDILKTATAASEYMLRVMQ